MLAAAAIVRVLQWVALAGLSCNVMSTTFFTCRPVMTRIWPGRGASSSNAVMPPSRKRFRRRATFSDVMPHPRSDLPVLQTFGSQQHDEAAPLGMMATSAAEPAAPAWFSVPGQE
jgi:hypothetical protein